MTPWLTVIGIGDDGLQGLSAAARAIVDAAEVLVGGDRHQEMVTETAAERLTWAGGLELAMDAIAQQRGRRVVVLATGDPMWFGAGANLSRRFEASEMTIIPAPGAYSLAAARMGWPLADVSLVTVHGRPLETLHLYLQPGARLLVLSRDGDTPAEVARLLTERGFGASELTVLEHLGGACERRVEGIASEWSHRRAADLNTLAIRCRAMPGATLLPSVPGLSDDVFESDGQLTKREARTITVAALVPLPGQVLWDVGAGSGSIGIEWLRAQPRYRVAGGEAARAVAIERDESRCGTIARNAAALGVPDLVVVHGDAPEAFGRIELHPDTVFVGGGLSQPGMLDACWKVLNQGGRLVANAVTLEAASALTAFRERHGGELTRLAVARAEPVGRLSAFRPLMEVTQYTGIKI